MSLTFVTVLALGVAIGKASSSNAFRLESATFKEAGTLPASTVHSRCGGDNRSPALTWQGAPAGTQSFAMVLFDPDAPGGGFYHWGIANLPPSTTSLSEGRVPSGALLAINDFGEAGYGGPCPPPGKPHRYELTLYALDVPRLNAPGGFSVKDLQSLVAAHVLAQAKLTGRYGR